MNVLWADDEPDVVRTFCPLLGPSEATVHPVPGGAEALDALRRGNYDVLILDLSMPPGDWGGLWLLERLRDDQIPVPVLVLSGEGAQTQTIQALRLGARDYVRKEDVVQELAERVRAIVEADQQTALEEILRAGPTPVAVPLKRYLAAVTPVSRLRRMVELYEAMLRLGGLLSLAELRHSGTEPPPADRLSIRALGNPAMGTWQHVSSAFKALPPEPSVGRRIAGSFEAKLTDSVIKLRNDIVHGGDPSETVARDTLGQLETGLLAGLARLRHIKLDIVMSTGLQWDGAAFTVTVVEVRGESVALPVATRTSTTAPVTGHTYLVNSDDGHADWIPMHPLLVAEAGRDPGIWDVYVFDGFGNRSSVLLDDQPLRYLNVWSASRGSAPVAAGTAGDLRGIAADWADDAERSSSGSASD